MKPTNDVLVVAELSANHGGLLERARETIRAIAQTGADAVKLQTYTANSMTIDCDSPDFLRSTDGTIWAGESLYELYQRAYTPWEWHPELKELAESLGLVFFSTPFDFDAVDFLTDLAIPIYKIASFEITDIPLIEYVASKGKPIFISIGIADAGDIQTAVDACRRAGNNDITLLQCTSSYPAPTALSNLKMIPNLAETFGVKAGISDHTMGSAVSIAAVALGATVVEKHFILDRSYGGPDATFSMEPKEFKAMVDDIHVVQEALGGVDYSLTEAKLKGRKFARSLFVVKDIRKGETITEQNVRSIRPGNGMPPKYLSQVIGRRAARNLKRGEPLSWMMIEETRS